ncbi:beta-adaptin-like protein C isoform X2 [Arachis ipaensis]|uniref:beta-adaptin-like protein C isoform X1 n=1 Tax=Arachis ipaensis TaxID=130454 RepID=UPI000A2B3E59|nr:beta-adaptin-like protein C isoform X1 [Arachis ipaensis]XP_020974440.1 beta-adaptin-like protein C isoform X2 [Arachis ipaensis]
MLIVQLYYQLLSIDVVRNLCKKMAPPLVILLYAEPEIQYVALRNINLMVQRRPPILAHEIKKGCSRNWSLCNQIRDDSGTEGPQQMIQAAKDVVLAEKPVITDDSNQLDSSLLDELLVNIITLSSVYHKPPDAFVTRAHTSAQKAEDEEYPAGSETAYSESSSANPANGAISTSASVAPPSPPPAVPMPDLLGDLMSLVPTDEPATPAG